MNKMLMVFILVVNTSQLEAYIPIKAVVSILTDTHRKVNDSIHLLELPKEHLIKTINSDTKPIAIDWKLLMDIEFKLEYYDAYEIEIETPVFTDAVKEIDGKEVIIKGYIIPIDESGKQIVLSANPFSSCFFCGNASPASIISMNLKKKEHYKMDASIKFKGILRLNYDDPEEFYYVLDNAVPVK